jgi:hypothetical protein
MAAQICSEIPRTPAQILWKIPRVGAFFIYAAATLRLESAMRSLIYRLLATAWLAFIVSPASGAEIREVVPDRFADVILEGKIEPGD